MEIETMTSIKDVYKKLLIQGFCVTLEDEFCIKLQIENCKMEADEDCVNFSNNKGYSTHSHPEDNSENIYDAVYCEIMYYIDRIDDLKNRSVYYYYVFGGLSEL